MKKLQGSWLFAFLIVSVLGLAGYANTFSAPFVFDDKNIISDNPAVRDWKLLTERPEVEGRYIGFLSFALNYRIHGFNVAGFHAFNLLIHIINALLVYWMAILTFRTPFFRTEATEPRAEGIERRAVAFALFSALLFVCHPVQTQAVTYIVQRFTSLATLFYLLSLVMYIRFKLEVMGDGSGATNKRPFLLHASRFTLYGLSLLSAVLAMKTKEIAFTLPLVITLYEFMFFQGKPLKRLIIILPLLLTILIIPLRMISLDRPIGEIISDVSQVTKVQSDLSRTDYLFTQFRVIVTYLRLLVLPVNQNLDYDYPVYRSFADPGVFLSFLFLVSLFCLGLYCLFRSSRVSDQASRFTPYALRLFSFGIFWFFITLSVESSFIPIADVIVEHRLYLPSVGAFMAVTGLCGMLAEQYREKWVGKTVIILLTAAVVLFTGLTFTRNAVWKNEMSLWKDVVRKSPGRARPHHGLGVAYAKRGMTDEAVRELERAILLDPLYALAHHDLGSAYIEKGRFDDALRAFRKALELAPQYSSSYTGMGTVYLKKGMIEKAIEYYQLAVSFNRYDQTAYYNLEYARQLKNSPLQ